MKHSTLILFLALQALPVFLIAQQQEIDLYKGCNALYAEDVETILSQFRSLVDKDTIKEYETFMITTKLTTDLKFKITAFEQTLSSEDRAELRMPLQHYSNCRTSFSSDLGLSIQSVDPSKQVLRPCDKTYAVEMQEVLNRQKEIVSPQKLTSYKEYMIVLKYYEDLVFKTGEFEKKTSKVAFGRLRLPLQKYLNCRDSIIRLNASTPKLRAP